MTERTTRRRFLVGGLAAAVSSLAGCSSVTPFVGRRLETTEQFAVDGIDALAIDLDRGSITVETDDRDTVRVDATKQSSSASVDLENLHLRSDRDGNRLRLYSEWEGDESVVSNRPQLSLDVTIPHSVALSTAETSTGSVEVDGTRGDLTVETSTGSIDVTDVDGTVDAVADTGSVTIRNPGTLGTVTTQTGSIDVDVPALADDIRIETATGSVTARVAQDLDADVTVTVSTGSITVEGVVLETERQNQTLLTGQLGEGGPELAIRATTGSVRIEPLDPSPQTGNDNLLVTPLVPFQ